MRLVLAALVLASITGCSSFRRAVVPVSAAHAKYPISFTSWLADESGPVEPSRLEVVGAFEYKAPSCAESVDISDEANRQIAAANGQAIVRLVFTGAADELCVTTTAQGDIVRVKATGGGK